MSRVVFVSRVLAVLLISISFSGARLAWAGPAAVPVGLELVQAKSNSGSRPTAAANQVDGDIRVDGRLDEPAWQTASPIGPLIQREPNEGAPASEETEVRVLFSGDALYFGILCRDRTPDAIVATQLTRDADLEMDDSVFVVLDPFLD